MTCTYPQSTAPKTRAMFHDVVLVLALAVIAAPLAIIALGAG